MTISFSQKLILSLLGSFLLAPHGYLFGQGAPQNAFHSTELSQLTPVSPNAAALGKFGNIPVGLYTGIPQVSVPIYSIKYKDLQLPVSVDFHLGGVKVEEVASWTGLSTALNAGGVITRTVRGQPDERYNLYSTAVSNILSLDNGDPQNYSNLYTQLGLVNQAQLDTEPDLYYFNFGGYSGKFYMGSDGKTFYPIPYQKIKIYPEAGYTRWVIITPEGTKYIFGTSLDNSRNAIETTTTTNFSLNPSTGEVSQANVPMSTPTAWYLVDVVSANSNIISLFYTQESYSFHTTLNETDHQLLMDEVVESPCISCSPYYATPRYRYISYSKNDMLGQRLSQIAFGKHRLVFNGDSCRYDLPGTKSLHNIQLFSDSLSAPLKTFQFYYSYFSSFGVSASPVQQCNTPAEELAAKYRLRLDSLVETGQLGSRKAPYLFTYDATPLPSRYSRFLPEVFAQDYWGFYNGALNNLNQAGLPTLIPILDEDIYGNGTTYTIIPGAVRTVDSNFSKAAILTQVSYPTGGTTNFQFESNQADAVKGAAQNIPANKVQQVVGVDFEYDYRLPVTSLIPDTVSTPFTIFSDEHQLWADSGATVVLHQFDRAGQQDPIGCNVGDGCTLIGCQDLKTKKFFSINYTNNSSFFLPNGSYRIFVTLSSGKTNVYTMLQASLNWSGMVKPDPKLPLTKNIGGLRIHQTTDYDGINHARDVIKTYSYLKFGSKTSSGMVLTYPVYSYRFYTSVDKHVEIINQQTSTTLFPLDYIVHSSTSNYPLLTTNGSPVGYSQVTVQEGSVGGKTEYTFTDASSFPDFNNPNFPFPPSSSFDWKRGLELKRTTYNQFGSTYTPVSENRKGYDFDSHGYFTNVAVGIKVGITGTNANDNNVYAHATSGTYQSPTGWFNLASDTLRTYDKTNSSLYTQKVTRYAMDTSSLLPRAIFSQTSKGNQLITVKTYPGNYLFPSSSGAPAYLGIKNLYNNHILTAVVEQTEQRQPAGSTAVYTLGSMLTTYKYNRPLLDSVYILENAVPIVNYSPAMLTTGGFAKNALYVPSYSNLKYDPSGNVLERAKVKGPHISYVWDDWQENPIAEIKNASSAQVAFTSFEYADRGNWNYASNQAQRDNYAKTGKYKFYMSALNPVISGALPAGTYIVSCWANFAPTANGAPMVSKSAVYKPASYVFYQSQTTVTSGGTITVAGAGQLDELRLYPLGGSVTGYTYFPLVGVAGMANPSGHVTTYEYDDLQRLTDIKDDSAQIKKHFNYHYTQKAFKSAQFSGTFTKTCGLGSVSNSYYTWPAGSDSSYISQPVANALAYSHFQINGQAYANSNADCWVGTNAYCMIYPKIPPIKSNYRITFSQQVSVTLGTFSRSIVDTSYDGLIYAHSIYIGSANYSFTQPIARGSTGLVTRVPAPGSATVQNIIIDSVQNVTPGVTTGLRAFATRIRPSDPNNIQPNVSNGYTPYITPIIDSSCLAVYYNDAQSQVFTRNNCTSGTGTSKPYIILAQTYSSHTSKAAANQLALHDIAINGQTWVNSVASGAQCLIHHDTTWQAADPQSCTKVSPANPAQPVFANYTIRDSVVNSSFVLITIARNQSEPSTYEAGVTWKTTNPSYSETDRLLFGKKSFTTTLPLGTILPGNVSGLSITKVINDNIPITNGFFPYASRIRIIDGLPDPSGYKEANTQNAGTHTYFPPVYSTSSCPLNQP